MFKNLKRFRMEHGLLKHYLTMFNVFCLFFPVIFLILGQYPDTYLFILFMFYGFLFFFFFGGGALKIQIYLTITNIQMMINTTYV